MWSTVICVVFVGLVLLQRRLQVRYHQETPFTVWKNAFGHAIVSSFWLGVVSLMITFTIWSVCDWSFLDSFMAATGAASTPMMITFVGLWFRSKWKVRPLVFDCGEHSAKRLFLFYLVVLTIFTIISASVTFVFFGKVAFQVFLRDVFILAFVASGNLYCLIMARSRLQIVDNGIWGYCRLYSWEQIESYEWLCEYGGVAPGKVTLILMTKTKLPLIGLRCFPIQLEHQKTIDELLRQHLPGCEVKREPNCVVFA